MTETKKKVLDSAYQLFTEKGYSQTSMRDISAMSGVSQGGIYNHYQSKEDIFIELLFENVPLKKFSDIFKNEAKENNDPLELFTNTARKMVKSIDEKNISLLIIEHHEFKTRHLHGLMNSLASNLKGIESIIKKLQNNDKIVKYDPGLIVQSFLAMLAVEVIVARKIEKREISTKRIKDLVKLFLKGALVN